MRELPPSKEKVLPKTSLEWIAYALNDAATALPVLFTMLAKIGAKEGAMVADEILGHVKCAQKECAHLVEAERRAVHEPCAECQRMREGLQLIATDEHRLMNVTARNTAQAILNGKPSGVSAPPPAVDDAQRSALVYVLRDLKAGIAEHATDVVWYSAIQTACDRIEEIASALSAPIVARYCPFSHRPCEPIELDGETVEVATLTKPAARCQCDTPVPAMDDCTCANCGSALGEG